MLKRSFFITLFLCNTIVFSQETNSKNIVQKLFNQNIVDLVSFKNDSGVIGFSSAMTGDIVIEPVFKYITDIRGGHNIIFKIREYFEVMDNSGNILIDETKKYEDIIKANNSEEYFVKKNNRYGVVDVSGNVVVPFKYSIIENVYGDQTYYIGKNSEESLVLINGKEEVVIEINYKNDFWASNWSKDNSFIEISKNTLIGEKPNNTDVVIHGNILFSKKLKKIVFSDNIPVNYSFLDNNLGFIISMEGNYLKDGKIKVYSVLEDKIIFSGHGNDISILENRYWVVTTRDDKTRSAVYHVNNLNKAIDYPYYFQNIKDNYKKSTDFYISTIKIGGDKDTDYRDVKGHGFYDKHGRNVYTSYSDFLKYKVVYDNLIVVDESPQIKNCKVYNYKTNSIGNLSNVIFKEFDLEGNPIFQIYNKNKLLKFNVADGTQSIIRN
jgi:hypothetical protein